MISKIRMAYRRCLLHSLNLLHKFDIFVGMWEEGWIREELWDKSVWSMVVCFKF